MKLLPPPEGHCRICACQHEPEMPHNAGSLFYQMRFNMRYHRSATWADALAHCDEKTRLWWQAALNEKGAWSEPPADQPPISEPIDG